MDEIHAFAGDDRGWHLLAVIERIQRLSRHRIQRLGLSATVGNAEALLGWLAGSSDAKRRVTAPPADSLATPRVELDYVGSLSNAALVLSRLHRGEKRLVFCESRSRVELLAAELRKRGVDTYLSHSSLSRDERHRAESAFSEGSDCVIVATSTLELGIDVGDLDRVIQIDAPPSVASLLQRMGRTGRRSGSERNCLILATGDDALIRSAGVAQIWSEGYVEPVSPPIDPLHVLAQQIMALALQQGGVGRETWREWIGRMPGFAGLDAGEQEAVLRHMLETEVLWEDQGLLWFGRRGKEVYGRQNFMDLLSVITSPPRFTVLHGRQELGHIDQSSILLGEAEAQNMLLAGRSWHIRSIDWQRRIVYVEPTGHIGRSFWIGEARPLHYRLCQAMKRVLVGVVEPEGLSRRGRERLEEVRHEYPWLEADNTVLVSEGDKGSTWWTFGGFFANAALASCFRKRTPRVIRFDNLSVGFPEHREVGKVVELIEGARRSGADELVPDISDRALEGLKFIDCLPDRLARSVLRRRWQDAQALQQVLESRPRASVPPPPSG